MRIPPAPLSRRDLLRRSGLGLGRCANSLLGESLSAADRVNPLAPQAPHLAPKARRIIHLFMNGGPSHVDTFDPKPALAKHAGQELPGGSLATERKTGPRFRPPTRSLDTVRAALKSVRSFRTWRTASTTWS